MNQVVLSNGVNLNALCFGTGIVRNYRYGNKSVINRLKHTAYDFLKDKKQYKIDKKFRSVVNISMQNGCNMFDTSRAYGGAEYELGKVLRQYRREEYLIVTKLSNADQFSNNVRGGLNNSLEELGMDYVDLYLMHWPVSEVYLESWKQMEELYKEGKCRAIGVCNCNIHHLQEIESVAEIMPMVNEIECHPLFTQNELREYCNSHKIHIMAYTSTARMDERLKKTVLSPISKNYNKSITQIILRWHIQIGNIPIVSTSNKNHILDNCNIFDFSLTNEEIDSISRININSRLR